ncbi:conserved hypothetical protein [Gloeothece citriformis PCC 7424]|uniref:Prolyl 4-hydroxylase alpha subunit Fe(2+) 2OG dioxygenase domain-containing protein n=1 Tax=Gloeothece citriformis (strain PCC 7424) TaxID=65393 RepID=B7KBJ2_GLOC7|nr:2OG-Fe(II) oxygenase [Gloeothece citriformis]ACK72970.1 conserved hypothetical protein [Gloeothece citriformis PCC 7424]
MVQTLTRQDKILNQLTEESLKQVLFGDALAIQVPNFLETPLCQKLASWYENHYQRQQYSTEFYKDGKVFQVNLGVLRIGTPYNLTYGKAKTDPIWEKYYLDAQINMQARQSICFPHTDPIELLKSKLCDLCEHGATIASFDDKPMFSGIGRVSLPNAKANEIQPHCDCLPEDYQLDGQFGVNFYLEVPEEGGELKVWDMKPLTPLEIKKMNIEKQWQSPSIKTHLIKPQQGDLVIINTRRPHAIKAYSEGKRISLATFMGYKHNQPFLMWT